MCVESFFFLKAIGSKSLFVGVAVSFDLYPRVVTRTETEVLPTKIPNAQNGTATPEAHRPCNMPAAKQLQLTRLTVSVLLHVYILCEANLRSVRASLEKVCGGSVLTVLAQRQQRN